MVESEIRLDDLLTRDLSVQWFEGVALVQSVCRQLTAAGAGVHEFPALPQISLRPEGAVAIKGVSNGQSAAAAAHLLAEMSGSDAPVRLRLVITQATANDSAFPTLSELSEALAYFERPDSQQILRQLYERAVLLPSRADQATSAEAVATVHDDLPELSPSATRKPTSRAAILAATVAAVVCASVWMIGFDSGSPRVEAALDTLKQTISTGGVSHAHEPVEKETSQPSRPVIRSKGTLRTGNDRSSAQRTDRAAARSLPAPNVTLPSLLPVALRATPPRAPEFWSLEAEPVVVVASAYRDRQGNEVGAGRLFSKDDAGISLPRHVYPKLPDEPGPTSGPDDRTLLELVIATDGLVERVKLRSAPRDIHEFMLVSAAKAWRFEPATLDGRPVRFLHTVAITAR